ncbi:MAG: sugar ABC transporter permease [Nitrososphaerota archaeon]|nr:sugar ABC transporter permease [Candidatus Calditenuaceae archaeon]MDW8073471.1 sugar ABC transporter permease [Nitrososphaerota archaeon]
MSLPALIFALIFIFYPLVQMFYLSLFRWTFVSPTMVFVGLENYTRMFFNDAVYLRSLLNVVLLAAQSSAIQIPIGIAFATIILRNRRVGGLFWAIIFLPYVISSVAVSLIWTWMYNPYFGSVNIFLNAVGLGFLARPWLGDVNTALIAIFGTVNWIYIGLTTTMTIATLRSIPPSIFESARVDGLSGFQEFRKITLPLLKELITVLVIIDIAGAFKFFDLIWVMTQGGPSDSTHVTTTWLYRAAFRASEPGYGAAIGVTIFVISFVVVQLLIKFMRSRLTR